MSRVEESDGVAPAEGFCGAVRSGRAGCQGVRLRKERQSPLGQRTLRGSEEADPGKQPQLDIAVTVPENNVSPGTGCHPGVQKNAS